MVESIDNATSGSALVRIEQQEEQEPQPQQEKPQAQQEQEEEPLELETEITGDTNSTDGEKETNDVDDSTNINNPTTTTPRISSPANDNSHVDHYIRGLTCDICLIDYETNDVVAWSKNPACDHAFHCDCIMEWLTRKSTCPFCRHEYLVEDEEDSDDDKPPRHGSSLLELAATPWHMVVDVRLDRNFTAI